MNDRWDRLSFLIDHALPLDSAAREVFLRSECGADTALFDEVNALLASEESTATGIRSHLNVARLHLAGDVLAGETLGPGKEIGPYRIVRQIGKGGMGVVYEAMRCDDQFQHAVAIKLIGEGVHSEQLLSRFRAERQMLASLDHPNIARIFDGGVLENGRPYFVMELVDGLPLLQYCRQKNISIPARLALFRSICAAVQHAHLRMIVHRDIKPGNILVSSDGIPKLLDFGIAKALDAGEPGTGESRTETGMQFMTPDYASPEQVRGETVTAATDVYALGGVLYELLCGKKAHRFKDRSTLEIARVICESEISKPSAVAPSLRKQIAGDLDNIVLRAMRKEPDRRYNSAEQLSEDVRRHLEGLPVIAAPDRFGYRARKFVGRNRLAIVAASLVLASLCGGLITTLYEKQRAERRFQDVRSLANTFLFDFDKEIQNVAGTTKARELVVSTTLKYLDSLSRETGNDRALTLELATAYQRVGAVQGYPPLPNLGKMDDAVVNFRRAIAMLQPRVNRNDASRQELRVLNETWEKLSQVQHAQRSPDAIASLGKSISFGRMLCVTRPDRPEDYNAVAAPLVELAALDEERGQIAEARKKYEEALNFRELLLSALPTPASWVRMAGILLSTANCDRRQGDVEGSHTMLMRARGSVQKAIDAETGNSRYRRQAFLILHGETRLAWSDSEPSLGDIASARASAEQEIAIANGAALSDPKNVLAKLDQVAAWEMAAEVNMESNPAQVVAWMQSTIHTLGELSHLGVSPAQIGLYERSAKLALGQALVAQGRLPEGRALIEGIAAEEDEIAARSPARAASTSRRIDAHLSLGRLLCRLHRDEAGILELEKARNIASQSAQASVEDIQPLCEWSHCLSALAAAWKIAGHPDKERECRERNLALWRGWNSNHRAYPYSRRREAEALLQIGARLRPAESRGDLGPP